MAGDETCGRSRNLWPEPVFASFGSGRTEDVCFIIILSIGILSNKIVKTQHFNREAGKTSAYQAEVGVGTGAEKKQKTVSAPQPCIQERLFWKSICLMISFFP